MSKEELEITAYHEAGHALVGLLLPEYTDPLYKITIIPRGRALGVTHSLPEKETYMTSKDRMLARIAFCMGGRAAEELIFNHVATGPASDFQDATSTARKMVMQYGMSEKLGMVSYNDFRYLSQHTIQLIDDEIRSITHQSYERAKQLLQANHDKLDLLAKKLLEKETLFAGEIYELLGITPREQFKLI